MAVDEEGGIVLRLSGGTRMTGSMAIGATGASAAENARATGRLIGGEVRALGFNVNFAPSLDVNSNPANPVIGTRSFSDDPRAVATLGAAWVAGHAESGAIATLKHFPGHGDTNTDTHLGLSSVSKTYEQLSACELVPFRACAGSADMVMTAHVTLPAYDDEETFADGSRGFFPATMSRKVITGLLRGDVGYDGVVVTDALEMGAISQLREAVGGASQAEQDANIAERVIDAGCDVLLLPYDLKDAGAAGRYDDYVAAIASRVRTPGNPGGTIEPSRIDESVRRILALKRRYGFLKDPTPAGDVASVGSEGHHALEMEIARQAVTLVRNDARTLPAQARGARVVLLGRSRGDTVALEHAVGDLQGLGVVPGDARVVNLAAGTERGEEGSATRVTIDYTYDVSDAANPKLRYTDELGAAVAEADLVVGVAKTYSLDALKKGAPQYEAIRRPLEDAHAAGARYVLISDNLPYDVARYQDADAIMCAYMGTGTDIDPTARQDGSATVGAFNANLVAAVESVFGHTPPTGTLPVSVPAIVEAADGTLSYSETKTLYARGFGLQYYAPTPSPKPSPTPVPTPTPAPTPSLVPTLAPVPSGRTAPSYASGGYVSSHPSDSGTATQATSGKAVRRVAGADRYETMEAAVRDGFERSDWVVVATGEGFADALSAASVAGAHRAPVVLTGSGALSPQARRAIGRLGATHAVVCGGPLAVGETVVGELEGLGLDVTRVAGADRWATSAAALGATLAAGRSPDTVLVATGSSFADALSAGPYCWASPAPVLLARDGALTEEGVEAVRSLAGVRRVVLLGGEAAVSDMVRTQLGDAYEYVRLGGADRYETSAAVAAWACGQGLSWRTPIVATGAGFADALSGAALAGSLGSPLLLAGGQGESAASQLSEHRADVRSLCALGGEAAVSPSLLEALTRAIS